jgi:epoxyqueuosine reductase
VTLLLNYNSPAKQIDSEAPIVAKYALHNDYHLVIKYLLRKLLDRINAELVKTSGVGCVDTSPVFERAYARKSGLGWIGKNMCLINKEHGSFVFICELFLDIELEYDSEIENLCGSCTECIDACPTGALSDQHYINANKCLAYLTIEHKTGFSDLIAEKLNNHIYGCDICQDVCPWNKKAEYSKPNHLTINESLLDMTLNDWKNLDMEKFNRIFKDSSIKRIGYEKLKNLFCIIEEQNKKVKG